MGVGAHNFDELIHGQWRPVFGKVPDERIDRLFRSPRIQFWID